MTQRRWTTAVIACAVAGATTFACSPPQAQQERETGSTVKIGFLRPSTGPFAANGLDMEHGWELYWSQHDGRAAGKKVETTVEDTAGNPSVAINKAKLLFDRRDVDMLVGPLAANEGLAVADAMGRKDVPIVMPIVSADDLTQRKPVENVVRLAGWTSSQTTHPLGEYAYGKGYRKVVTIGYDFAFGYEGVGGFVNTFTDKGGRVVKQLWSPTNTQDYSTYVAQIKNSRPDAVFAMLSGADASRFFKAYRDFGLRKTIPLLGGETLTDQSVLKSLGDGAEGLVSSGHFVEGADAAETQQFVEDFHAKYKKYPSYYSANTYAAASGVAKALEALDGDVSDAEAVVKALKNVSLTKTPMGPQELDSHGNPVFDVSIRKVVKGPHGLWNVPTKTYEQVGQFWRYDEKEFLRHPVYSKSYQGAGVWPNPRK